MNQNKKGFSLIELCIVIVIIAILLVIAYPSYSAHIIRTHRTEATTALLDLAGKLEQYYLTYQTYQGATLADLHIKNTTAHDLYQLNIAFANNETYTVTAVPLGNQKRDTQCDTFIYHQNGEKEISGSGSEGDCW